MYLNSLAFNIYFSCSSNLGRGADVITYTKVIDEL